MYGLIFGGIGVVIGAGVIVDMQRNVIITKRLGKCIFLVLGIFIWGLGVEIFGWWLTVVGVLWVKVCVVL